MTPLTGFQALEAMAGLKRHDASSPALLSMPLVWISCLLMVVGGGFI
nr:hypothetical protein [Candidatus Sigynarchaeota archaeon]